jgi:predicted nucleic acid-binding protein
MRAFLDTNILIYSVSRTLSEFPKRDRARELIATGTCALSVQVLQEFYAPDYPPDAQNAPWLG